MTLILTGFLVALLGLVSARTSGSNVPGWTYSLTTMAIPLAMALAARKQARFNELQPVKPDSKEGP